MKKIKLFSRVLLVAWMLMMTGKAGAQDVASDTASPVALPAAGQELSAEEIIQKANRASYYAGQDGISDVKMKILDGQGRERVREFRILRLNVKEGGEQKFFVYFSKPTDVSKMVYMVWKQIGRDDDRWLYLPALDLVRRVAASDKRSSFVGSHFVYEDVSGRSPDADIHELEESNGTGHYQLKSTPKNSSEVEFAYYYVWIRQRDYIPVKIEYYDAKNQLIRLVESLEIKEINGFPTVTKSMVKDLQRGGETWMEFTNIRYNVGLTDDIFTERYLRQAPAQWIQK